MKKTENLRRIGKRWLGGAALAALAVALAVAPMPARGIERYHAAIYRGLQPRLTALSNLVPFALLDLLLAVALGAWLALAVRDIARRPASGALAAAGRVAGRTVVWAAAAYLVFLVVWGLNYRRVPLAEKLSFDREAVTEGNARRLAVTVVGQLNALHDEAHAAGWPAPGAVDAALAAALARADRAVGGNGTLVAGRPKSTLLNFYFRRAGVDGMIDPFFLETLVSGDLLPFERPFVLAHEWSHLAGVADEGDANFLGWLACVQASPAAQYSGWLFLYGEVAGGLAGPERVETALRLAEGPRADLAAIRARLVRAVNPRVAAAGWRVYDQYLKANRVEAGANSYGHVVRLVLGVRFGPGWVPLRDDVR